MKKKIDPKKLALSTLTLKNLASDQLADVKGGAMDQVPMTSRRPDCSCA